MAGQNFNYAFDDIGNRKSAGTGSSAALRTQLYAVNRLNQVTNRTVPGFVEVNGSAVSDATVTVNGTVAARQGEYFRQEVAVDNSASAVLQWLTNRAALGAATSVVSRLSQLPQTPETSIYDWDGNLVQDGALELPNLEFQLSVSSVFSVATWDGENCLTRMESRTNAVSDSGFWRRLNFSYDYQGRRIRKQVSGWTGSSWAQLAAQRYFYDGWNLMGQVDEVTGQRLSFLWGLDLSGTLQGAGGVAGLLAMIVHNGGQTSTYFLGYDGNGNVTVLANAADGSESGRYEYGPFGELIRASGPMAKVNSFRFSTKFMDDETDLVYYGFRYYNSSTGRWLSRDSISELGLQMIIIDGNISINLREEKNLYLCVMNSPLNLYDKDGRLTGYVIAGIALAAYACAKPHADKAWRDYEDSGDKFKHCWVGCRMSKTCGASFAGLAAISKEVRDRAVAIYCKSHPDAEICQGGHGDFMDSILDLVAHHLCIGWESHLGPAGGWIGAICRQSCEDCCKAKVGYKN